MRALLENSHVLLRAVQIADGLDTAR
jgi:hypothetical protein